MGSLKPGATYVYERHDGVVYAREHGAAPETRQVIGWEYKPTSNLPNVTSAKKTTGNKELDDHNEWIRIRLEAKTNPALQKAVERVKMLYKLSKEKYE
jgi:hypothetical protein